jgi:arginase
MHEVDRLGVGEVVKKALKHVNPKGDRPVHLSFDVDACDPSVAGSQSLFHRGSDRIWAS